MPERPLRFCDVCGGLDDHPRHVIGLPPDHPAGQVTDELFALVDERVLSGKMPPPPAAAYAELARTTVLVRHLDCCAAQGCEVCAVTEAATNGKRGHALVKVIADGALDDVDVNGLNVGGI